MKTINYTIAVMIYNVERFLVPCIESCISQNGDDIEILLIDDGSTDSSGKICDQYSEKDFRVRVIHQNNGGVSNARNTAIKNAKGRWLIMVDGDDVLAENAIEYGRRFVDDDSDLLQFDAVPFSEKFTLADWKPKAEEMTVTGERLSDYHMQLIDRTNIRGGEFPTYNLNPAWSKMWSMDFIKRHNLWYEENVHKGEGTLFTFTASYVMKKIRIIPYVLYGYRINPTSIMRRFSPEILDNQNVQYLSYYDVIEKHNEIKEKDILEALNRRGLYLIENAIQLGIAHPDCKWNKSRKIAWAKKLCGFSWVTQAVEYASREGILTKENKFIAENDIPGFVRHCDWLKWKRKVRYKLKNIIGNGIVQYYRKIRYGKVS